MTSTVTSELIPEVLAEYGDITRAALKQYLPTGHPNDYFYDLVADYPSRGGKMMRPSICLATARAFGADTAQAIKSACAIELLHNALLIHDDIEDESETRRGEPTLHALHGVPLALNAGDGLSLLSLRPLIENRNTLGPHLAFRILEETERMARETAEGQALELGWRKDNTLDLNDEDYLVMVLKKTCWLATIFPARIGAIIGSRDSVSLEPFERFGFFLGAAFQIQDDLLNLVADEKYGKERDGDIWEGKRTIMLLHLVRQSSAKERDRIHEFLSLPRGEREQSEVESIRKRMIERGSVDYAKSLAHGLAGAASYECERAYAGLPDSRDKQFVKGLVTWVFERG